MLGGVVMSLHPKPYLSPKDYLALERRAEFKSEYFDGEIFAMILKTTTCVENLAKYPP